MKCVNYFEIFIIIIFFEVSLASYFNKKYAYLLSVDQIQQHLDSFTFKKN